jgi:UDP-N-acetyl-D-galactosamine dehydrogenase
MDKLTRLKIAVLGCGYVGLPLIIELSKHFSVLGFDVDQSRIKELKTFIDRNGDYSAKEMSGAEVEFSFDKQKLKGFDVFIVAVPTPVLNDRPDLSCLIDAAQTVSSSLSSGNCVIFESTVSPGCTRNVCLPILEKGSGLKAGKDFLLAYSPERINPGDQSHALSKVAKVVSGLDDKSFRFVTRLYEKIVPSIHEAESLEVAEASKLLENIQRDVNIALLNELQFCFDEMGIPMDSVLKSASSKWNFNNYHPGLVGGHCVPVDPYYLIDEAKKFSANLPLIAQARKTNEEAVANFYRKILNKLKRPYASSYVLINGLSFKPDVPDIRNTQVPSLKSMLEQNGVKVDIYDPNVKPEVAKNSFGIELLKKLPTFDNYHLIVSPYDLSIKRGGRF